MNSIITVDCSVRQWSTLVSAREAVYRLALGQLLSNSVRAYVPVGERSGDGPLARAWCVLSGSLRNLLLYGRGTSSRCGSQVSLTSAYFRRSGATTVVILHSGVCEIELGATGTVRVDESERVRRRCSPVQATSPMLAPLGHAIAACNAEELSHDPTLSATRNRGQWKSCVTAPARYPSSKRPVRSFR